MGTKKITYGEQDSKAGKYRLCGWEWHQTHCLAKGGARKSMQNGNGRLEGFHDSSIASSEFTEGPSLFLKKGNDGLNRVTLQKLLGAWVFG